MKKHILKSLVSDLSPNTANLDYSFKETDRVPQPDPEMLRLHTWHVTGLPYTS